MQIRDSVGRAQWGKKGRDDNDKQNIQRQRQIQKHRRIPQKG